MTTNESIAFGQRLRQLRAERGISKDHFARKTGIHATSIRRFERGDREPLLKSILRLARLGPARNPARYWTPSESGG